MDDIDRLQRGINERQDELQKVTNVLAKVARDLSRRASVAKVVLIVLGALVATRETATQLFGASNNGAAVVYALFGASVATVAGLEAAFKWESRSADLNVLAAQCHTAIRNVDSTWRRTVGITDGPEQIAGALALLEMQDQALADAQRQAATFRASVTLDVRPVDTDRGPGPYAA